MGTAFDDEEYVTGALRAGADAFLLKDTEPATLVATVHRVRAGEQVLDPKVTGVVVGQWRAWAAGRSAPELAAGSGPAGAVARLTQREREVLIAFARGGSNPDVADQLGVGQATVKANVHALLRKLGCTTPHPARRGRLRVRLIIVGHRPRPPDTAAVTCGSPDCRRDVTETSPIRSMVAAVAPSISQAKPGHRART